MNAFKQTILQKIELIKTDLEKFSKYVFFLITYNTLYIYIYIDATIYLRYYYLR